MAASSRALVNCDVRRAAPSLSKARNRLVKSSKEAKIQVSKYLNCPNKPIFCLRLMRSDVEADNNRKAICLMVLDRR